VDACVPDQEHKESREQLLEKFMYHLIIIILCLQSLRRFLYLDFINR